MFVWKDRVTGSINFARLIAEYPDHPETKRLLAEREEVQVSAEPELEPTVASADDSAEKPKPPPAKKTPAKAPAKKTTSRKRGS